MTPDDDREGAVGPPARILLVEDDTNYARQLEDHLVDATLVAGQVDHVSTLADALDRLQDGASRPDAVLLDLTLPDASGLETVRAVVEAAPDLPVVVLTPSEDREVALEALRERAEDCLSKNEADREFLARSVQYALERKRAERELAEARRKLDLLDEYLQEVFYLWDFSTDPPTLAYCSSAYEKIWGRSVEEVTQDPLTFIEGIYPEDREQVRKNLNAKLRGERHLDYRVSRPDGELRWIRDRSYPIRDEDGEIRWVAGTAADITQQKDLEADLAQERIQLEEVFHEAPAFLAVLRGEDHVFERANPTYRNLAGNRELLGRSVREVFPEIDDRFFDILDQVYHTGEPYHADEQPIDLDTGNGIDRRYLNFVYQPLTEAGEVNGILAHGVDVTEQWDNREALRQSEARYRTLVETMAEATVILDRDGRIMFANGEAEQLLDLEPSELQGLSYNDPAWRVTTPEGGLFPAEKLPFRQVMKTGRPVRNVEHRIEHPDGTHLIVSVNAAPLADDPADQISVVATMRDVTERVHLEQELRHQVLHDPLTELPNRTLVGDRLKQAVAQGRRDGTLVGLLMLDVDRFKQINDHLGHTAGDRVLKELAERIRGAVREEDTAGRLGGDEFAILLSGLEGVDDLTSVRDRLMAAMAKPYRLAGEFADIDVTVGAVLYGGEDVDLAVAIEEPDDLLRYADLALLQAKETSGPSFHLFHPDDQLGQARALGREQELRQAIREEQFEVHWQPLYRLRDGELWGVEPLARWRHPERGLVSPAEFIPLAEETGLIHELGTLLFREVCRDAASWPPEAGSRLQITPNLSGRQFDRDGLPDALLGMIGQANLNPGRFWWEITETALTRATGEIESLREHGFGVLVDDFGSGYSSFHYLRDQRFDGLKIDMSFVQGLGTGDESEALITTMITMGKALDMKVVAEGIETTEQQDTLTRLGCEIGQGFLFSRPMTNDQLTEMFRQEAPKVKVGG